MKITISEQDLAKAPPQPQTQTPYSPQSSTSYPTTKPANPLNPMWFIAGAGLFIVLIFLGGITYTLLHSGPTGHSDQTNQTQPKIPTKAEFIKDYVANIHEHLKEKNNFFFQYVEGAHGTVTAKNATIKTCTVDTIDGTDSVGLDHKNISRINVCVTVTWDGLLHQGGFTEVAIVIDAQQDKILDAQITATDAMVNTYDPNFWQNVIGTGTAFLFLL